MVKQKKEKYKKLESVPNFSELEKEIIVRWERINVVEKLKELRKDAEEKVYYDGPITANNMPHYGHAIQWTLKDLIPRYWSMKGYFVSRNMGWDCQGIPVEYEVEKELGFIKKEDIEEYGVAKFNKLCRESVFKYRDSIFYYETRLGRWFDNNDMYYTMDKDYIESMWWSLKRLYEKGLLYEGHKVVAYSTRAGTSLSTHEVNAGGYAELEDPFVTVKFELSKQPNTFVLAWTTTPWTIPGNLLLAVGKKIDYVKVKHNNEFYILAKDRLKETFKDKEYEVIEPINATDLEGLEYKPPFSYFESKRSEGVFKIIFADHATTEEGTGIVHLAPYGAEDFDIFMTLGITLFDYLDETAHFTDLVPDYKGLFYKDADSKVVEDLVKEKLLFDSGTVLHRMPMCWRTDTPLIYKPLKSWYVKVTALKDRMLEENKSVSWVPEYVGTKQAATWIENARDWALSRNRYWGTPLPVWVNGKTGEKIFIGSFTELEEQSGVEIEDPHRPYVDAITWEDKKTGGTFRRVSDVIDVWYDSGAAPFAMLHYPFENKELFKLKFPADYVSEMTEQARLWFYTMLVLGVALFDKIPYKNVVAHGVMLAKDGKKLSKSKRNFPPMDEVLDEFGGDILRFFILNSPLVQAESARFYKEILADVRKEFFLPLWNSVKYFVLYANLYGFDGNTMKPTTKNALDLWILARLQDTVNSMNEKLDNYLILEAARLLKPFVSDLSVWYIRRSRDRIKNGNTEALQTFYYVLSVLTKLLAPFTPFISEELYTVLDLRSVTGLDSVHLDLYPESKKLTVAQIHLLEKMQNTRNVVSAALSLRVENKLKVRQPLSTLYILSTKETAVFAELISDEVNVKQVKAVKTAPDISTLVETLDFTVYLDTTLTTDLKTEGTARELIRILQDLRKKQKLNVIDQINAVYEETLENQAAVKAFGAMIKNTVLAKTLTPGDKTEIKLL